MGEPTWLFRSVSITACDNFQKQPLWVSDKSIELDGIRLDVEDVAPTIQ